jgi:aryl-alcohol dehydrogenase-like predicted oxidoreductase
MTLDTTFATRSLGNHGPVVSALGLGCMAMSEFYGKRICTTDHHLVGHLSLRRPDHIQLQNWSSATNQGRS